MFIIKVKTCWFKGVSFVVAGYFVMTRFFVCLTVKIEYYAIIRFTSTSINDVKGGYVFYPCVCLSVSMRAII